MAQKRDNANDKLEPRPGEDREEERERIRSSNDRDQELEREGEQSRHNRGYDEAVRGSESSGTGSVTDVDRVDRTDE